MALNKSFISLSSLDICTICPRIELVHSNSRVNRTMCLACNAFAFSDSGFDRWGKSKSYSKYYNKHQYGSIYGLIKDLKHVYETPGCQGPRNEVGVTKSEF